MQLKPWMAFIILVVSLVMLVGCVSGGGGGDEGTPTPGSEYNCITDCWGPCFDKCRAACTGPFDKYYTYSDCVQFCYDSCADDCHCQ